MHRAIAIVALVLVNGACSSTSNSPASTSAVLDPAATALAAAVDIRATGCRTVDVRGAGSVIVGNQILTAAHVVSGAESITVRSAAAGALPIAAHLVAIDAVHDLALLDADPAVLADRVPLVVGADGVEAGGGDKGAAVLFRDGAAVVTPYTITKPVVVRILDIHHENKVERPGYEVVIKIAAGDSGAVMVSTDGQAIGVLYANSREADARAFASDTGAVDALIAAAAGVDAAVGIDTGACV